MDSGYYFMVSHLHRHFQAVLLSTIQLEKLNIGHYVGWTFTMFYRYCGYIFKSICLPHTYVTSRTNICLPVFSTFSDKNMIFGIFTSHNHHTLPYASSGIHYYATLPSAISCPRYAINNSSRVDCSPNDMVTFMAFPLPVSTLIVFALISIFFHLRYLHKKTLSIAHSKMHKLWITILVITNSILDFS